MSCIQKLTVSCVSNEEIVQNWPNSVWLGLFCVAAKFLFVDHSGTRKHSQPCELIYLNLNNQFISFHIGWSMSLWAQRVAQRIWRKTCKWYFSLSLGVKITDCVPFYDATVASIPSNARSQRSADALTESATFKAFFWVLVFSHVKSSIWCDFHWKKVREN